jgi:hydroxymethylbilane synthase
VRGVEQAVLSGRADVAVHSAKDVPGERPLGLALAAVIARADPRDALCGATGLDDLREGARVGTSSLRRRAQLPALRPDLCVAELHGNVDSRLRRLTDGAFDAVVLAAAGLERLGLTADAILDPEQMLPAPGQGSLMVECRVDDAEAIELAAVVNDPGTERALQAERTLARALGATCRTPLGAYAELCGDQPTLDVFGGSADGAIRARVAATDHAWCGPRLAQTTVHRLRQEHRRALHAALDADPDGEP